VSSATDSALQTNVQCLTCFGRNASPVRELTGAGPATFLKQLGRPGTDLPQ
jgi:hypothetical protein